MPTVCLILSDDLLDASRIAGHARAAGYDPVTAREPAPLLAALDRRPALALLDLHNPGLALEAVVPALRAAGVTVIGFGPHVDVARLKAARAAGCDEVLPRSAFFGELDRRLGDWAGAGRHTGSPDHGHPRGDIRST